MLVVTVSCTGTSENPFIYATLGAVFSHMGLTDNHAGRGITVTFLADDDFFPQSAVDKLTLETEAGVKEFRVYAGEISDVPKSGLGSSATLVTSFTAALLQYFTGTSNKDIIYKLALSSHQLAQGKVGSGFDISAACWGSHVFKVMSRSNS